MNQSNNKLDAVQMVRDIRDKHYRQTRAMTKKQRLKLYRKQGQDAQNKLYQLAKEKNLAQFITT